MQHATISDERCFEVSTTTIHTLSVGLLQCFAGRNNRHSDKTAAISAGHSFQYVTNQPSMGNSVFHPSGVGKWVSASAGKAKAGMVHSVSGCE